MFKIKLFVFATFIALAVLIVLSIRRAGRNARRGQPNASGRAGNRR